MAKSFTRTSLARRLTQAAVALTGDDPLRQVSVEAVGRHIGITNWELLDRGIEEARRLGWLKTSGGPHPHSISVGVQWRIEQRTSSSR